MTPKKEETKRLQGASKETDSINGRERFAQAMADSCVHVPDKRTKQEKKKDKELRKKEIDAILKEWLFKGGIETKISNRIKDLKFCRVILIVGENADLAERVAVCISMIYGKLYSRPLLNLSLIDGKCTVREPGFKDQSYVGWDEVDIKHHLFLSQNPNPFIYHFKKGDILFLRGINDEKTLERLIDTVRECRLLPLGFLIIKTNKADIISREFLDMTEIIYLKTTLLFKDDASTVIVNDKIFTDLPENEYKLLKLLYNKKGAIANYKEIKGSVFGPSTSEQQIHNAISNLKKKFNKYLDIENKRGVGYAMTV